MTLDRADHRSRITEGVIPIMADAVPTRTVEIEMVPELAESFR